MRKQRECECPPLSVSALSPFDAQSLLSFRPRLHERVYRVRQRYAMPHSTPSLSFPHERDANVGPCGTAPFFVPPPPFRRKQSAAREGFPPPHPPPSFARKVGTENASRLPPLFMRKQKHEQRAVLDKTLHRSALILAYA
jgi:hypothetical protein